VLEWFDFAVYGYFASNIGHQFFPTSTPAVQQLLTFGTFALGFLARPVGSLVLGRVGDRIGRRALLTLSISLMGGATLILGLLPTYEQIGIAAPALLLLMRLAQGFSLGGEFTGSMVYTTEGSSPLIRGLVSSSTAAGTRWLHPRFGLGMGRQRPCCRRPGRDGDGACRCRQRRLLRAGWCLREGHQRVGRKGLKAAEVRPLASLLADWKPIVQTFGIVAMMNAAHYLVHLRRGTPQSMTGESGNAFLFANTLTLFVVLFAAAGGWLSTAPPAPDDGATVVTMAAILALRMLYGTPLEFTLGQMRWPCRWGCRSARARWSSDLPLRRGSRRCFAYSMTPLAGGSAPLVSSWLIETLQWRSRPRSTSWHGAIDQR
jgi:MHS family proline/betaine transporter-like MFS transporter